MIYAIIPTYDEAKNIIPLLREVRSVLPEATLFVVDDSSPDGTGALVQEFQSTDPLVELYTRSGKEGLGKAYLAAFKRVLAKPDADAVLMMDADFSHAPAYLPKLVSALVDADVVVGSRYVPGGSTTGWERWRVVLSRGGNWYARMIMRSPVRDVTAGFYALRASALRSISLEDFTASGYAFQIELKHRLKKAGLTFHEHPIHFVNRREGESKISHHIISEGLIAPWKLLLWKS